MMNLNTTFFLAFSQDEHFTKPLQAEVINLGFQNYKLSGEWNECMSLIRGHFPAIFVCDIDGFLESGNITHLDQLKMIIETTPTIVVSSHEESKRFTELNLLDFKPFINKPSFEKNLMSALNVAFIINKRGQWDYNPSITIKPLKKLFFKIGNSLKSYKVKEIDYFYSDQKMNYAKVNTRSLPTMIQLKTLEERFQHNFIRIHRGYLVNLDKIDEIDFCENTVIVKNTPLPLGEKFKKSILNRIELIK